MLSRCYGYYPVYIECSSSCLATILGTLNASNSKCFVRETIVKPTQQRIAIDPKRTITVLPLFKRADAK